MSPARLTPAVSLGLPDPKSADSSAGQQLQSSSSWEDRQASGVPASPPPCWRHPGLFTFLLSWLLGQRRAVAGAPVS